MTGSNFDVPSNIRMADMLKASPDVVRYTRPDLYLSNDTRKCNTDAFMVSQGLPCDLHRYGPYDKYSTASMPEVVYDLIHHNTTKAAWHKMASVI